jgi:hypothetical protein
MDNRQPKKVEDIKANIEAASTSRAVAEKPLEETKLSADAKPFVPSTNKGGRSHRRKSLKKKTSKRRKYHRRS